MTNWARVGRFGAIGLPAGILSVFGYIPPAIEPLIWLVVSAWWIWVLPRAEPEAPFRHFFFASVLAHFLVADAHAILFDQYVANNPHIAEAVAELPEDATPRSGILIAGIFRGAIFGVVGGFATALMARFMAARSAALEPVALTSGDSEEE